VPSRAFISDIHSNLEALTAVLKDIDARRIKDIVCLGDIVGYGPNPGECVDIVAKRCRVILMGNHDYALLYGPIGFSKIAADAIHCTQEMMVERCKDTRKRSKRQRFLERLPLHVKENNCLYVHASPREPLQEYLLPTDVEYGPTRKIIECFQLFDHLCFVGHTHRPGIMTMGGPFVHPRRAEERYPITSEKLVVNDGSVGQPRDGDPRACWLEVTEKEFVFHRVEYDYRPTQDKIMELGCLHPMCAERLAKGI
jgi:diadenosine tetraphosphatase ApaH/serine/threonine PP2A family protein phosphatase